MEENIALEVDGIGSSFILLEYPAREELELDHEGSVVPFSAAGEAEATSELEEVAESELSTRSTLAVFSCSRRMYCTRSHDVEVKVFPLVVDL